MSDYESASEHEQEEDSGSDADAKPEPLPTRLIGLSTDGVDAVSVLGNTLCDFVPITRMSNHAMWQPHGAKMTLEDVFQMCRAAHQITKESIDSLAPQTLPEHNPASPIWNLRSSIETVKAACEMLHIARTVDDPATRDATFARWLVDRGLKTHLFFHVHTHGAIYICGADVDPEDALEKCHAQRMYMFKCAMDFFVVATRLKACRVSYTQSGYTHIDRSRAQIELRVSTDVETHGTAPTGYTLRTNMAPGAKSECCYRPEYDIISPIFAALAFDPVFCAGVKEIEHNIYPERGAAWALTCLVIMTRSAPGLRSCFVGVNSYNCHHTSGRFIARMCETLDRVVVYAHSLDGLVEIDGCLVTRLPSTRFQAIGVRLNDIDIPWTGISDPSRIIACSLHVSTSTVGACISALKQLPSLTELDVALSMSRDGHDLYVCAAGVYSLVKALRQTKLADLRLRDAWFHGVSQYFEVTELFFLAMYKQGVSMPSVNRLFVQSQSPWDYSILTKGGQKSSHPDPFKHKEKGARVDFEKAPCLFPNVTELVCVRNRQGSNVMVDPEALCDAHPHTVFMCCPTGASRVMLRWENVIKDLPDDYPKHLTRCNDILLGRVRGVYMCMVSTFVAAFTRSCRDSCLRGSVRAVTPLVLGFLSGKVTGVSDIVPEPERCFSVGTRTFNTEDLLKMFKFEAIGQKSPDEQMWTHTGAKWIMTKWMANVTGVRNTYGAPMAAAPAPAPKKRVRKRKRKRW